MSDLRLGVIRSKAEYTRVAAARDAIIGEDEVHPLAQRFHVSPGVFLES